MKNILVLFSLFVIALTSCTPSATPLTLNFSDTTFTESGHSNMSKSMTTTITNTTNTNSIISWDFSETAAVSGWSYSISVGTTDATGNSGTFELTSASGSTPIAANASLTVTVTVTPNNYIGTGEVSLNFTEGTRTLGGIAYSFTANSAPAQFSLSTTNESGTSPVTPYYEAPYETIITNLTNSPLDVTWTRHINPTNPTEWFYANKTSYICHSPPIGTYTHTIPANGTINLGIAIHVNNTTGTGEVTHHIYLAPDSANTVQTFAVTHTAN